MPIAILLAMQAAGMIVDYMGTQQQKAYGQLGTQLDQAALDSNLELTRVEGADNSLQAMKKLRQNLGTQAAVFAARGTRGDAGSALSIGQTSISNFNTDERTRRMNLLSKEAQLRAGKILSGLHQLTSETQLGQSMTSRFLNKLPTDPDVWEKGAKQFGKGFGLTQLG